MKQGWWIAIVAVVGVVLAFLLFPRPDTGAALPGASPDVAKPGRPTPAGDQAAGETPRGAVDPSRVRTGIKPGQEGLVAKRNRPEVIYASKLVTPFSAIRYGLIKDGSEEAKTLVDHIATVMTALHDMRLDPDSMTWDELQAKTDAQIAEIKASKFATNDQVVKSLERYDQFITEYKTAKQAEGTPGATPAPAPTEGEEAQ
jgi:hypothetical protein